MNGIICFNCELGIIDSIAIRRAGSGDGITMTDLPLEVEVSITIKDLYESLSITKSDNLSMLANNIGLIDYVATLSGVTTNKPDILRKLDVFITAKLDTILQLPGNIKGRIIDTFRDELMKIAKF